MTAPDTPAWLAEIVGRAEDDYRFLMKLFEGRGGRELPSALQWDLLDKLIEAYVLAVRPEGKTTGGR